MLPGLHSAATALTAAEQNQEVIARNLAHIDVGGYRRQVAAFEPFVADLSQQVANNLKPGSAGTRVDVVHTDFTPGAIKTTGRSLDFALNGDGFFAVEGPDGPLYTRNGSFQLTSDRQLVTADGRAVLGEGGPLSIPPEITPSQIIVGLDGSISAGGAEVGRLQIATFEDNQQLVPVGTTLYEAPDGVTPGSGATTIQQGAREMSNVSPVTELIRMIVGMRHYEASQRAIRSINEAVEQSTKPSAG